MSTFTNPFVNTQVCIFENNLTCVLMGNVILSVMSWKCHHISSHILLLIHDKITFLPQFLKSHVDITTPTLSLNLASKWYAVEDKKNTVPWHPDRHQAKSACKRTNMQLKEAWGMWHNIVLNQQPGCTEV